MYILGLATMGDAAAVLMKGNEIIAAAEEERFSRQKHHVGFPNEAVKYCLREAGITMNEVLPLLSDKINDVLCDLQIDQPIAIIIDTISTVFLCASDGGHGHQGNQ